MNFLEWLGIKKVMKDTDQKNVIDFPTDHARSVNTPQGREHYRVGFTTAGGTTLTLIGSSGMSMTLTMTPEYCERLIRMLRATYMDEEPKEDTDE